MARIYLSSTYEDLKDHRAAIVRLLRRLNDVQVRTMEDYVASDERPADKCIADARASDVYVGLFAWRYGFVPTTDNPNHLSITELEYRAAKEAGKQCLIFLLSEEDDVPWVRKYMDEVTKDNEAGARIRKLREELKLDKTVSFFKSADELAGLVSAAVQSWQPKPAPKPPILENPQARELRRSLIVAYSGLDDAITQSISHAVQSWLPRPVLLSSTALFARDELDFAKIESELVACDAGVVVLSPASLAQLKSTADGVATVLAGFEARLGRVAALLLGVAPGDLPPSWRFDQIFVLPAAFRADVASPELSAIQNWVSAATTSGTRQVVGLPISLLAMREDELAALVADPARIGNEIGVAVQQRFEQLCSQLDGMGIDWKKRYGSRRRAWHPFGPAAGSAISILNEVVTTINKRSLRKLRDRMIKPQLYPYDAVLEQYLGKDTRWRRVYEDVARTGCLLVVDEMSLFEPSLREALRSSPFSTSEMVAVVSISPFDPAGAPVEQALDSEPRSRLTSAFARYAQDFDPQCELAVGDVRHLRRWLHASLPETVIALREPRPDQDAMRSFYASTLGAQVTPTKTGNLWAGGGS